MELREEWGRPMSDTEVDGTTPDDDVEVRDEGVTTPDDADARDDDLTFFPTGEHHETDWVQSLLIVGPLVLGLLVVAAIGARMLVADVPDPAAGPGDVVIADNSLCWDGSDRPDDGCPVPSGRAGLRWVFPSFQPNNLGCRNVLPQFPRSTRPAMYECEAGVDAGAAAIVYSQLTQVNRGRVSFEKLYGAQPEEIDDAFGRRLLWTEGDDAGADGDYDLAVMYPALPFAVEISADSAQARDQALDTVVRFRASEDVMDHP